MSGVVIKARISAMPKSLFDPMPKVYVVFKNEDGSLSPERELFEFYPDEISFTADEFIGKTENEARALKHQKDVAYIRS